MFIQHQHSPGTQIKAHLMLIKTLITLLNHLWCYTHFYAKKNKKKVNNKKNKNKKILCQFL